MYWQIDDRVGNNNATMCTFLGKNNFIKQKRNYILVRPESSVMSVVASFLM